MEGKRIERIATDIMARKMRETLHTRGGAGPKNKERKYLPKPPPPQLKVGKKEMVDEPPQEAEQDPTAHCGDEWEETNQWPEQGKENGQDLDGKKEEAIQDDDDGQEIPKWNETEVVQNVEDWAEKQQSAEGKDEDDGDKPAPAPTIVPVKDIKPSNRPNFIPLNTGSKGMGPQIRGFPTPLTHPPPVLAPKGTFMRPIDDPRLKEFFASREKVGGNLQPRRS